MTPDFDIPEVHPLDKVAEARIWATLDEKTKPRRSLGELEHLAARLFTIRTPSSEPRAAVVVMASDHGVAEEGVSAYPQQVTGQMLLNFQHGGAAINALCKSAGADLIVVDIGTMGPTPRGVRNEKVREGSANMTKGAALTLAETRAAMRVGLRLAEELSSREYDLVALGEMGIGNTTAASALTAALLNVSLEHVVGHGTGIDEQRRTHKRMIVGRALHRHRDAQTPIEWLSRVGGLEIAGLTGLVLGAAHRGMGVVLDGFITGAAALVAARLQPAVAQYCFASHQSTEPGHAAILDALGLRPLLRLELRLGEGSGAALSLPLFRAAAHIYREMATFDSAGVSKQSD